MCVCGGEVLIFEEALVNSPEMFKQSTVIESVLQNNLRQLLQYKQEDKRSLCEDIYLLEIKNNLFQKTRHPNPVITSLRYTNPVMV